MRSGEASNSSGYNAGVEILLALGIGVGLASVAGVRAFSPLLLAFAFVVFGLLAFSDIADALEARLAIVLGALAVLAVLEIALDKVKGAERGFNLAMIPVRAVAGAFLAAAMAPAAGFVPFLVVGAVVAGAVAVLKVLLRPPGRVASSGVSAAFLSLMEDVVALVGGLVGLFVPLAPVVLVGFLLFFYARIRRRRGRKFGGLRILGD